MIPTPDHEYDVTQLSKRQLLLEVVEDFRFLAARLIAMQDANAAIRQNQQALLNQFADVRREFADIRHATATLAGGRIPLENAVRAATDAPVPPPPPSAPDVPHA